MSKRLGFDLRICGDSYSCDVCPRDWGIMTSMSRFSHLSMCFRSNFGVDALSSEVALSSPTATVNRRLSQFLTQVKAMKVFYFQEAEELKYNYQVSKRGEPKNSRNSSCVYLRHPAFAVGSSGFCYLELSNSKTGLDKRVIGMLDLRPYTEFEVDMGEILKISKRKARESRINSILDESIAFLSKYDPFEKVEIDLFG